MVQASVHETWSSRSAFVLAAVGAAVGLGNIWRFPYIAGQNGGGAFVLIYVGFVLLLGIPIITAELAMGRRGQQSAVVTMSKLAREANCSQGWQVIGWLSILIPMMGLTYYSVVAGWALDYVFQSAIGSFRGFDGNGSSAFFAELLASPWRMIFWHSVFIGLTVFVVARGVRKGLERSVKIMMPALFVILLLMVAYAIFAADFMAGVRFLFTPDFSKITVSVVLMALGQALFSVAVGVGAMITYGAYLPKNISLPWAAAVIGIVDTLVAILAGLAIFPLVLGYGLDPGEGPGLIFVTLPVAFGQMPAGTLVGSAFFVLLTFAALTSSIGMLEPAVSWLEEHRGFNRPVMALLAGLAAWLVGLAIALSFNLWGDFRPLGVFSFFAEKTLFDVMDFLVANIMLPINALLIAVFAGWMMSRNATLEELALPDGLRYVFWRFILRYIAPLAFGVIFFTSLN
ncbi:MAG: sodium-dependent transporter [Xanthomonadales bacterium]